MKTYHDIVSDGGSDVAAQVAEQDGRLRHRLSRVRHVVAVMSGKGGVGKSSLTVNLASALARDGHRTGIIDADINGASTVQMTGVARHPERTENGILPARTEDRVEVMSIDLFLEKGTPVQWNAITDHSAFTWRGMVEVAAVREMLADTAWSDLDMLLVDLPPGTDKLPNLLDLIPSLSGAVVVTVPSRASVYVVRKSIQLALEKSRNAPIGLVENMSEFVCDDCGHVHKLFPEAEADNLVSEFGIADLGSIPFDPVLGEHTDGGISYLARHEERPAAAAIREVASRLWDLVSIPITIPAMSEDSP